jgi:hypothetical protein
MWSSRRRLVPSAFLLLVCLWAAPSLRAGEGFFHNVSREKGLSGKKTLRAIFADLDGDTWPDAVLDRQHVFLSRPCEGGRRFVESTSESGLRECLSRDGKFHRPGILIAADVDNDGDVDLYAGYYLELEKPARAESGQAPRKAGDGLVLEKSDTGMRSTLLLNDGRGRFRPKVESGLALPPETTSAATFLDYDNDGILDLFTGNWYRYYGWSLEAYPDRLYRGRGDGSFVEVTHRTGLLTVGMPGYRNSSKPTYGVAHTDWNNDGRQDILVAVYGRQWNFLWMNRPDGTFEDVAPRTHFDGDAVRHGKHPPGVGRRTEKPFRANGNTFDIAPCDFDNDGDVDVFLSEITHWWAGDSSDPSALLVNQGAEKGFSFLRDPDRIRRIEPSRARWNRGDLHAGWIDVDNDMRPDLVLASSDYPDDQFLRLFLQGDEGSFRDATEEAGFCWRNPTGISFADYDGDGDVDILVGNNNMRLTAEQRKGRVLEAALFENRLGQGRNFLSVRLRGGGAGRSNRPGIGARVWVSAGDVVQMREVYGGQGHAGHQDWPVLHFGLGRAGKVDWLRVRWPDARGTTRSFPRPGINRFLLVGEDGKVEVLRDVGPRGKTPDPEEEDF